MMKGAFIGDSQRIFQVFGPVHRAAFAERLDMPADVISGHDLSARMSELRDVQVLVSTWGMPNFTREQLDGMPLLKLVLYGAGDTRYFAPVLLERGIQVVSAWRANAVPVAEFVLAQILLSGKGYFRNVADFRATRDFRSSRFGPGNWGLTVALLGVGAVGQAVLDRIRPYDFKVIVFDPFLTEARASELVVEKVELDIAFAQADIVSNHLLDTAETKRMLTEPLFASMRENATFINSGRGQTVDTEAFLRVFTKRKDLMALLDVTDPEPLPADSPLWQLDNVVISTHIAGSNGNEHVRMATLCLEELDRFLSGEPLQHEVTN